jgi:hypothetical protein
VHLGSGALGLWGTWALGHLGSGALGVWGTWVLGHLGSGAIGLWSTWALGYFLLLFGPGVNSQDFGAVTQFPAGEHYPLLLLLFLLLLLLLLLFIGLLGCWAVEHCLLVTL